MRQYAQYAAAGVIIALVSCPAVFAAQEKTSPIAAPKVKAKAEPSEGAFLSGKVVETMNAGGYTYVCIEKADKKTWVAVPDMKVTVGQTMSFQPGQEMRDFASKSLGRTFDSIVFSAGPVEASHGAGKTSTGGKASVAALTKDVKVEKATGANAYTVGEVYEKRSSLNKKTAVVKGKVVKVSSGIMGTNWMHLQDGTGDSKKGTHDLVVTSDGEAAVGDVITVKGVVSKDKDFGGGYKYSVIMEKASIQR